MLPQKFSAATTAIFPVLFWAFGWPARPLLAGVPVAQPTTRLANMTAVSPPALMSDKTRRILGTPPTFRLLFWTLCNPQGLLETPKSVKEIDNHSKHWASRELGSKTAVTDSPQGLLSGGRGEYECEPVARIGPPHLLGEPGVE